MIEQRWSRKEVPNYYPWVNGLLKKYMRFLPAAAGEICKLLGFWNKGELPASFVGPGTWPVLLEFGLTGGVLFLGVEQMRIGQELREKYPATTGAPAIFENVITVGYNLEAGGARNWVAYQLQLSEILIDFNLGPLVYPTTCLYYQEIVADLTELSLGLGNRGIRVSMSDQVIILNLEHIQSTLNDPAQTTTLKASRVRGLIMGMGGLGPPTDKIGEAVERHLIPRALIEVLAAEPID